MTTGNGNVSPNYSNALLEIGHPYTITAIPSKGFVFSNWVGTVLGNGVFLSNTPRLSFMMQSNLVLQANFVPNPFIPVRGPTMASLAKHLGRWIAQGCSASRCPTAAPTAGV